MYPSDFSTSRTLARIREPGVETLGFRRSWALRMRVIKSLIGSCVLMFRSSLPARLHEAGNQAFEAELAHCDTAEFGLAIVRALTPRHFAADAIACRRGVARQLGKLQRRGKALFQRLRLVADDRFQPRAFGGHLLGHSCPPVVLLNRTLL